MLITDYVTLNKKSRASPLYKNAYTIQFFLKRQNKECEKTLDIHEIRIKLVPSVV